jgi:hypothetical protein
MSFAEMFLHLKSVFRGANLEEITELAGFWRLASADKAKLIGGIFKSRI